MLEPLSNSMAVHEVGEGPKGDRRGTEGGPKGDVDDWDCWFNTGFFGDGFKVLSSTRMEKHGNTIPCSCCRHSCFIVLASNYYFFLCFVPIFRLGISLSFSSNLTIKSSYSSYS